MFRKLSFVSMCAVMLAVISGAPVDAEERTPAQRKEQEKACEKQMTELDRKMHELSSEINKAEGKTRDEANNLYNEFKKQQRSAGKDFEELRKATNETWGNAKVELDRAIENLNGLYQRTKEQVEGKAR